MTALAKEKNALAMEGKIHTRILEGGGREETIGMVGRTFGP
jgi:hypothetical protein